MHVNSGICDVASVQQEYSRCDGASVHKNSIIRDMVSIQQDYSKV